MMRTKRWLKIFVVIMIIASAGFVAWAFLEARTTSSSTTRFLVQERNKNGCLSNMYQLVLSSQACSVRILSQRQTSHYVQTTYSVTARNTVQTVRTFANRKTDAQLSIASLGKKQSKFSALLADSVKKTLRDRFAKKQHLTLRVNNLKSDSLGATTNFMITKDERLLIVLNDFSDTTQNGQPLVVTVSPEALYDELKQSVVQDFLPKLKKQKQKEAALAKKAAADAKAAEALRKKQRSTMQFVDCATQKCIALTFDDGPHRQFTNELLDILTVRHASATFFMLGHSVAANPDIAKRMVAAHHEVANHTWIHPDLTALDTETIKREITTTDQAIFGATGVYPKLMRPPYGAADDRVLQVVGMPAVLWSVDTQDWLHKNTEEVYARAVHGARPGAIILMHDVYGSTIQAVPRIIDELTQQGYVFVTVSQLLGINGDNYNSFKGRLLQSR